jgi:hypothetical protein
MLPAFSGACQDALVHARLQGSAGEDRGRPEALGEDVDGERELKGDLRDREQEVRPVLLVGAEQQPFTPTQKPCPNRNVQSWTATSDSPATVSVPASVPAPAKLSRSVTTDSRPIAPTTMTIDSTVRLAT